MGLMTGDGGQRATDPQLRVCLVIPVGTWIYIMFSGFKKLICSSFGAYKSVFFRMDRLSLREVVPFPRPCVPFLWLL